MESAVKVEDEREEFIADFIVDKDSKKIMLRSTTNAYLRRIFVELPTVIFSVGIVLASFIAYFTW